MRHMILISSNEWIRYFFSLVLTVVNSLHCFCLISRRITNENLNRDNDKNVYNNIDRANENATKKI